jgi:hypothetical protein
MNASAERDFDTVFLTLAQLRLGALIVCNSAFQQPSHQLGERTHPVKATV